MSQNYSVTNTKKSRLCFLTFRAINHPKRSKMIDLLRQKDMTVSQVQLAMRSKYHSDASKDLAILKRVGIVDSYRDGQSVVYSLDKEHLANVEEAMNLVTKSDAAS